MKSIVTTAFCLAIAVALVAFHPIGLSAGEDETARKVTRIGIIGCDTSHVPAFTKLFNDDPEFDDFQVVAAYPGGSDDLPESRDRVDGFTRDLAAGGVKIVDSIDALLPLVDVVLLESVDGRKHLEQVRPVFAAGKPVFIDKPVAGSLADAVEIFRLAKEHDVPCFSSSSLRYSPRLTEALGSPQLKKVVGAQVHAPCKIEPHHPDLFWYGVHGIEILFTAMGPGCETVSRTHTDGTDIVVGVWKDGRVGVYRGLRQGASRYGITVFGERAVVSTELNSDYKTLAREIRQFFKTGKPPVAAEETIEMFTFMEAADESKRQGGKPVKLSEVIGKIGSSR